VGEGRQLEDGKPSKDSEEAPKEEDFDSRDEDDGPWYFGKAREEFHRRRGTKAVNRRGTEEEDPIQVGFLTYTRE